MYKVKFNFKRSYDPLARARVWSSHIAIWTWRKKEKNAGLALWVYAYTMMHALHMILYRAQWPRFVTGFFTGVQEDKIWMNVRNK